PPPIKLNLPSLGYSQLNSIFARAKNAIANKNQLPIEEERQFLLLFLKNRAMNKQTSDNVKNMPEYNVIIGHGR
ncbi:MAG TPA: hypothetical protein PLD88_05470, partial [Candidatus Berkiella sp.]|nr:hypothetical protein [Candidatus Berkiella sp.]